MISITPGKVSLEPIQWQGIELCLRVKEREMLALRSPFHFTEDYQQHHLVLFLANILSQLTGECSLLSRTQNEDPSLEPMIKKEVTGVHALEDSYCRPHIY